MRIQNPRFTLPPSTNHCVCQGRWEREIPPRRFILGNDKTRKHASRHLHASHTPCAPTEWGSPGLKCRGNGRSAPRVRPEKQNPKKSFFAISKTTCARSPPGPGRKGTKSSRSGPNPPQRVQSGRLVTLDQNHQHVSRLDGGWSVRDRNRENVSRLDHFGQFCTKIAKPCPD